MARKNINSANKNSVPRSKTTLGFRIFFGFIDILPLYQDTENFNELYIIVIAPIITA